MTHKSAWYSMAARRVVASVLHNDSGRTGAAQVSNSADLRVPTQDVTKTY